MMQGVRGSTALTSPARPGALFREGLGSFLGVLGLEDVARELRLLLERRAQLLAEPLEDICGRRGVRTVGDRLAQLAHCGAQLLGDVLVEIETLQRALLGRLHRERGIRDDPLRVLARRVEQLLARDDRVQQTHLERALGRNQVGAQQELHRLRPRDLARQAHRRAAAGEQPPLGFHDCELRLGARDADIATAEHLHAARGAEAVDGRDDRLVERPVPQHRTDSVIESVPVHLREPLLGDLLLELRDLGHVRLEVGAREERFADSGDDRDPRLVVGGKAFPRLAQQLEVLHVRGVAPPAGRS